MGLFIMTVIITITCYTIFDIVDENQKKLEWSLLL